MYSTKEEVKFFPTGSTLLNCVLGGSAEGGWARSRLINVVGDRSSGKTLLALEAFAQNLTTSPKSVNKYVEAESAFDLEYIESLQIPIDKIEMTEEIRTIEGLYDYVTKTEEKVDEDDDTLIVVDSLDALSDAAELAREFGKDTMGMTKAKKLSELFRRANAEYSHNNITLMIISQVRDLVGPVAGKTRAGGKALNFYESQELWLQEKKKISRTIGGIERVVGLEVNVKCKKNKVALPYRTCDINILFGHGVDNVWSNIEWLADVKALDRVPLLSEEDLNTKNSISAFAKKALYDITDDQRLEIDKALSLAVGELWLEIEDKFKVKNSKYKF